jgi:hypothetical protein
MHSRTQSVSQSVSHAQTHARTFAHARTSVLSAALCPRAHMHARTYSLAQSVTHACTHAPPRPLRPPSLDLWISLSSSLSVSLVLSLSFLLVVRRHCQRITTGSSRPPCAPIRTRMRGPWARESLGKKGGGVGWGGRVGKVLSPPAQRGGLSAALCAHLAHARIHTRTHAMRTKTASLRPLSPLNP